MKRDRVARLSTTSLVFSCFPSRSGLVIFMRQTVRPCKWSVWYKMNINQAHCLHTVWLRSTHSEILGDELRWLKQRWSSPSRVSIIFFHSVGLSNLAGGLEWRGQFYITKHGWNVKIVLLHRKSTCPEEHTEHETGDNWFPNTAGRAQQQL